MPVTDYGEDQDHGCDHQQTGCFEGINLRRAVVLKRRMLNGILLRLGTRRWHDNIVVPDGKSLSSFSTGPKKKL